MTRCLLASSADYPAIDRMQRDLCIALNPGCWFWSNHGRFDMPQPERQALPDMIRNEITALLEGGAIRDFIEAEL
jgi:hypothetical protein